MSRRLGAFALAFNAGLFTRVRICAVFDGVVTSFRTFSNSCAESILLSLRRLSWAGFLASTDLDSSNSAKAPTISLARSSSSSMFLKCFKVSSLGILSLLLLSLRIPRRQRAAEREITVQTLMLLLFAWLSSAKSTGIHGVVSVIRCSTVSPAEAINFLSFTALRTTASTIPLRLAPAPSISTSGLGRCSNTSLIAKRAFLDCADRSDSTLDRSSSKIVSILSYTEPDAVSAWQLTSLRVKVTASYCSSHSALLANSSICVAAAFGSSKGSNSSTRCTTTLASVACSSCAHVVASLEAALSFFELLFLGEGVVKGEVICSVLLFSEPMAVLSSLSLPFSSS
mmetsp:Transcript_24046/g.42432  ORF Transcript_24046/g.42432 Transcript_24046/m.42432 type:complete len:341 (+) Transcript_24046:135-1157(+)